jgi:hypothetical protein
MKKTENYEAPDIVFEGELEVQAGSPSGFLEDPFFDDGL